MTSNIDYEQKYNDLVERVVAHVTKLSELEVSRKKRLENAEETNAVAESYLVGLVDAYWNAASSARCDFAELLEESMENK